MARAGAGSGRIGESARHALEQRKKYARWLDAEDAAVVANAMLLIIGRALNMLKSQIEAQGQAFEATGGFSERLTARRRAAREETKAPAPKCPVCGKGMRRRKSAKGESWGAPGFRNARGPGRWGGREIDLVDDGGGNVNGVSEVPLRRRGASRFRRGIVR